MKDHKILIGFLIILLFFISGIALYSKNKSLANTTTSLSIGDLSKSDNDLINIAIDDIVKINKEAQEDLQKRRDEWLKKISEKEIDFLKLKGAIIERSGKPVKTTDVVEKPDSKGQLAIDPRLRIYQFIEKPNQDSQEKK